MRSRMLSLVIAISALPAPLLAQPDVRDHRDQRGDRRSRGPQEAPPPPRAETVTPRAGQVWIPGHWDYRADKYDWVPGHYEAERPAQKWVDGHWEKRGDVYVFIAGKWVDSGIVPPGDPHHPRPGRGPRQPPPPPRAEPMPPRPGQVFIPGHWDYRADKWEWMPGRWDKEHPAQKWVPGSWDKQGDVYVWVEGRWVDSGIVPPPVGSPPPPPPDRPDRPRHEWKLERPVVASYWPIKGKAGSRVTIRGRNFPSDAMILWNGEPVRGARVKADDIVFEVPATATTGAIALRTKTRDLAVGGFEVAAAYDPVAEAKRLEDERRARAEAAWVERQKQLAKDRAARETAWRERRDERARTREQRRAERIAELRAKWDREFLASPDTQDELTLHAQRVAELVRMRELAELASNGKLVIRVDVAQGRETDRHDQRMAALKAGFQGGKP